MKPTLFFCLALSLTGTSCERHAELRREITALKAALKQDNDTIRQCETDIAALGGGNALTRIVEQTEILRAQVTPLEFDNAARARKGSAIETRFARLRSAAEAFKAAQPK